MGVIRRINEAGAAILDREPADLTDVQFTELIHPEDLETSLEERALLLDQGHGGPLIVRVSTPTGAWVWIRAHGTMLPSDRPLALR